MYYPPEAFLNAELAYRREQIIAARRTRRRPGRGRWHPSLRITRSTFHRLAVGH